MYSRPPDGNRSLFCREPLLFILVEEFAYKEEAYSVDIQEFR
jgi:hypothetical protein